MTRRWLIPIAVMAFCLSLTASAVAQVGITATPQFPAPAQNVTIEAGAYSGSSFTCEPPFCLGMYSWVVVNGSNGFYRFAESWSDFAYLPPTNDSEPGQSMQPVTYTAYGGVVWNICTQLNYWVEPWICEASEPFYEVDAAYASATPSAQISSLSLSPTSGGGPRTTFEFVYSSAAGPGDIQQTWQIFHPTGQTSQSCVVGLYAPTFVVLWGDQGWQDQVSASLGDATVLENSQCRLHVATSSSSTSGNTRTVSLDVSFKPGYFGSKNVYMYGLNAAGTYSSPSLGGTWAARSQLNSATPSPAVLGQTITLAGVELGTTGTVKFTTASGSVDGTVVSPGWSTTGIPVTVPSTAVSGNVWVVVNGQASNTTSLTVETGPVITNVWPRWGPATMTTPITITGVNFGTTAGTVTWGGTAVAHATWSATSVTLQLPSGASTAQLKIVRAGVESNPFPFEVGEDGIEYIHSDGIGSVRMVTGHGGVVLERHDYRPFGEELGGRTSLSAFAGGQKDGETATTASLPMDYFGARHLQGALGRFAAVDPGHVNGNLSDAQSWNGYAYSRNNPLRFIDPDGLAYSVCFIGESGSCGTESDESFESNVLDYHGSGLTTYPDPPVNGLNRGRYTVAGLVGFGVYVQLWKDVPDMEASPGGLNAYTVADVTNSSVGVAAYLATSRASHLETIGQFAMNGRLYKQGYRGNQYVHSSVVAAAKSSQRNLAAVGRVATRGGAVVGGALAIRDVATGGASNQSIARGFVGAFGVGVAFVPTVGPFLSLGVSLANGAGAFDRGYEQLDNTPRFGK